MIKQNTTEQQPKKEALRDWIARRNGNLAPQEIGDQSGIFSERILKSVHVAELILFIEELNGHPVDVEELRPGAFSTIHAITATFFEEPIR